MECCTGAATGPPRPSRAAPVATGAATADLPSSASRGGWIGPASVCWHTPTTVIRSVGLFVLAAVAEIGGAWLVWQGVREHRGLLWVGAVVAALRFYGFVATLQPDAHFGRILAAYDGIFVAGSLAWGIVVDKFHPDRYDLIGATICLAGVAVIMFVPRG
jgi:small multidrug resistance family-3 protein